MKGGMQNWPLVVPSILDHAKREHPDREIVTRTGAGEWRRYGYFDLHGRARRVAKALQASGIKQGDRVATLAWNTDRHMEIWYGVMGLGAVCHTINPRLFPEQIAYIIRHAGDRLIFADACFMPLIERLAADGDSFPRIIAISEQGTPLGAALEVSDYEEWLAQADAQFEWPDLPEDTAAGLCYTSGTTGNPKGVLYSHRSNVLHALAMNQPDGLGISARDVVLPIVPMFHANAWALIFVAPMMGAKLVLPGPRLDGASVWELLEKEQVTVAAGVPTVWLGLLQHLDETHRKLPHLRRVLIGGSAMPSVMLERLEREFGVEVIHAWGMTEMSPIGTLCTSSAEEKGTDNMWRKLKQGRAPYTVEMRIVDDAGAEVPRDGRTPGKLLVRGPAVIDGYFGSENSACDAQGWFDTGDVAVIDDAGDMQIVDRTKDIIKSGGEWISSIKLENAAVGHPDVAEAAVIGVPDDKWGERPLLFLVSKPARTVDAQEVLTYLSTHVARWWVPERVEIVAQIPRTATGKIDKRALRARFVR